MNSLTSLSSTVRDWGRRRLCRPRTIVASSRFVIPGNGWWQSADPDGLTIGGLASTAWIVPS